MAEEQSKIPTSKIERTGKFVRTGLKVGGNYVKHFAKKLVNKEVSQEELDEANAKDIYNTLSELKGSALKVAQMLSMDRGILPAAFSDQFAQAQHKAPPLSGPLIVKTFKQYLAKSPQEIFDEFDMKAAHAASIGQVHKAKKDGKDLAIKIQYPGVGDSVISDLNLVRPVARRMFGWKDRDMEIYFEEVKARLVEETDYKLELRRSMEISEACKDLPNLVFSNYYPEYSAERIITMDWVDGLHLEDFLATNPSQEIRNQIGQALWDFYNFQIHKLRKMHADAHPGNYLFIPEGSVAILDFGCVKEIPEKFYDNYFQLLKPQILNNPEELERSLLAAQIIMEDDSPAEKELYTNIVLEALEMVLTPFHQERFDFSDEKYFDRIYEYGERMGRNPAMRNSRVPRGDADGMYLNRTYFGLFSILNQLGAEVETRKYMPAY
ncbi:MAG: AarF/UbiB family protein [Bacteroidia bacterium]|nr:AarF/UbiB family protein [Bacteroidia bacterium]